MQLTHMLTDFRFNKVTWFISSLSAISWTLMFLLMDFSFAGTVFFPFLFCAAEIINSFRAIFGLIFSNSSWAKDLSADAEQGSSVADNMLFTFMHLLPLVLFFAVGILPFFFAKAGLLFVEAYKIHKALGAATGEEEIAELRQQRNFVLRQAGVALAMGTILLVLTQASSIEMLTLMTIAAVVLGAYSVAAFYFNRGLHGVTEFGPDSDEGVEAEGAPRASRAPGAGQGYQLGGAHIGGRAPAPQRGAGASRPVVLENAANGGGGAPLHGAARSVASGDG